MTLHADEQQPHLVVATLQAASQWQPIMA